VSRLHFAPGCDVSIEGSTARVAWDGGSMTLELDPALSWIVAEGGEREGWYSPSFNRRMPAPVLVGSAAVALPLETCVTAEVSITSAVMRGTAGAGA
jgi:hypothetical protein